MELAADRFAGNVLQKMGATLAEAQAGINTFSIEDTKTHPPKSARLEAVASGWKQSQEKEAEKETPHYLRTHLTGTKNDIIVLQGQYTNWQKERDLNLSPPDALQRELNRLTMAVVNYIEDL